jgi:hypothetical protein
MSAAICRASSRESSFANDSSNGVILEIDLGKRLAALIPHDDTALEFFDGPWSWKADWHGASVPHRGARHLCLTSHSALDVPVRVSCDLCRPCKRPQRRSQEARGFLFSGETSSGRQLVNYLR